MGRVQKPKLLRCTWPQHASTEMCWKCVGNVSTEIDLSLMEGAWNAMVCVWMCACILCINKVPDASNLNRVTYGDNMVTMGQSIYRTFWAWLSTEESTSPESDSGHLISLIPVADFDVFEANLLPNLLQLDFNCMKERERERERPGVPSVLHRRMPMEDSSSLGEI